MKRLNVAQSWTRERTTCETNDERDMEGDFLTSGGSDAPDSLKTLLPKKRRQIDTKLTRQV